MDRRDFIRTSAFTGAFTFGSSFIPENFIILPDDAWFSKPMRWAQLTLVENDPGRFDPDFWLDYFKKVHADGATLSAGGIVAYYPTKVPFHHRSAWLGSMDSFGYLVSGCRRMNMSVIARTDPHAAWNDVYESHPDWIAVTAKGEYRRHWANPEMWVTCALGPYNFEFMSRVHEEIMDMYEPDGIFSNRWAGHGLCYCEHCRKNFREYSGKDLPKNADRFDPVYQKYMEWSTGRLKELWLKWDGIIRKRKPASRFVPNGFPDKVITGELSDIVFTDHQARSGYTMPWSNGRVAKELRASIGMKPLGGIFSVGLEEQYRWKDSVQTEAEIRTWVAEGVASGMRPWFTKFSGVLYDKRWLGTVERIYSNLYRIEKYLRNVKPLARVGLMFSEQTGNYGNEPWQQRTGDHSSGMYHALVESRIPFEMINDRLLSKEYLGSCKLLILPNIARLSDNQCNVIRDFVKNGGSILSTYETSLYNAEGKRRSDFGLADVFGASFDGSIEGPMQNSYLRLRQEATGEFHPVLSGLEDAFRIINTIYQVKVKPAATLPSPVTLIPSYPDLPMEHVYPREPETGIRELYLNEYGKGRTAYFPGDIDRSFWQVMCADHLKLIGNVIRWALNEDPVVDVKGPGIIDVSVWRQENSMTVHLVNLTNPMMMKGPSREFYQVDAEVSVRLPDGFTTSDVKLLMSQQRIRISKKQDMIYLQVPGITDHEIIGIDLIPA